MKSISIKFTTKVLSLMLIGLVLGTLAQYSNEIKVLTYNLFAGGHSNDGSYADIVEVLNDISADISGHQEVDSCNGRNSLDVINWLGEQTNMHSHFAPALKSWNGGKYGNGMLSTHEPISIRKFWADLGSFGAEDRSASEIEITMNGEKVRVLNTHVAYQGVQAPAAQAAQMIDWIDEGGDRSIPMIIMGDFNSYEGDAAMTHFEEAGFTYVRNDNGSVMDHIDHIMFRPKDRWTLLDKGKPTNYSASDHDPVWAILELDISSPIEKSAALTKNRLSLSNLSKNLIKFNLNQTSNVSLNIYSLSGKKIKSVLNKRRLLKGENVISLGNDFLSNGIYYLKFNLDKEQFIHKVIIN